MKVKFYLARATSKVETAIYARISYYGKQLSKYYLRESILPKHWNSKKHRAKEYAAFREHPEFNTKLDNFEIAAKYTVRKYMNDNSNMPPSEDTLELLLNEKYKPEKVAPKKEVPTFMEFFRDFIKRTENGERTVKKGKRKGKPITAGTIRTYTPTLLIMVDYETDRKKKLKFEDMTIEWYKDFLSYCISVNLSTNYIGKHIKTIKAVMKESVEDYKYHSNRDYESDSFASIQEEVDGIAIYAAELAELEGLDFSDDVRLDRARDWFVLGCNVGQRVGDTLRMTASMIKGDYIEIKAQEKTKEPIHIPLNDTVRNILAKYGGSFPPRVSDQKFNDALKDLGKQSKLLQAEYMYEYTKGGKEVKEVGPKYEFLSSHAMRRSFCTNEWIAGTPIQLIMSISGHKTEANFYKYIKVKSQDRAKQFKEVRDSRKSNA